MLNLIPEVKELKLLGGTLAKKAVCFDKSKYTPRLAKALSKLPADDFGAKLYIVYGEGSSEGYSLNISETDISIKAESERGAFYAIQTLRQIFEADEIPTLTINDKPDFEYRGFYHDVTRGKVATVDTIKGLIDKMAYFKMNALQLYVEHVFEFEECRDIIEATSYLTGAELRELDEYCKDNFIDFQPSLSTFGHLFELLEQEKYHHLRVIKDFVEDPCRWYDRMVHHTIDPSNPESIEIVKSLIDQYAPHFTSEYFNICCDETFDLKNSFEPEVEGELYIDFVKKIIAHVQSKGLRVMMWADILLQHPERITDIPEDVYFLNWTYGAEPDENKFATFAKLGRRQIVCPGTTTWNRFCERVEIEEANITRLAEYGYKYGAVGMLNTNWGDYGNPCSLETAYYGMVLGAAKSWNIKTQPDEAFYADVNAVLYKNPNAMSYLRRISDVHNDIRWEHIVRAAYYHREGKAFDFSLTAKAVTAAQELYSELYPEISAQDWQHEDFKAEMLLALDGVCVLAELGAKLAGVECSRVTDTKAFLERYRERWLAKNKISELERIEDVLLYIDSL